MNISAHNNMTSVWLKNSVTFGYSAIPNKYVSFCLFVKFITFDLWNVSEAKTPKYYKELWKMFVTIPNFKWCHVLHSFCWNLILQAHNSVCCFSPKTFWKILLMKHASRHLHYESILLSLTPFCWRVYDVVNWYSISVSSQNLLKVSEMYSLPLSDLIVWIKCALSFLTLALNFQNTPAASDFCFSKKIQHILVRSSIKTM